MKSTKMSLLFQAELKKHDLKLIDFYKSDDFGPLKYVDAKVLRYFSTFYAVAQPKENTQLVLYKLDCFSTKNFYTPNKILSETLNKKYSKDKDVNFKSITIPDCFRMFIAELDLNINKFELLKNIPGNSFN